MTYKDYLGGVLKEIKADKELYYSYQANIAMSFVDEARRQDSRDSYKNCIT